MTTCYDTFFSQLTHVLSDSVTATRNVLLTSKSFDEGCVRSNETRK